MYFAQSITHFNVCEMKKPNKLHPWQLSLLSSASQHVSPSLEEPPHLEHGQIKQGIKHFQVCLLSDACHLIAWAEAGQAESLLTLSPLGFGTVEFDGFLVHYIGGLKLIFLPDSSFLNFLMKVLEAFTRVLVCYILRSFY